MSDAASRGSETVRAWLLWILPWVAFGVALGGDFLWDDDRNVTANATLRSLAGLIRIWTDPWANQQYYPLTHTSFWLEYQLYGLWAAGYHAVNLVLQGAVAWQMWRVLRRLALPGAWVAALLFAVHPVQAESVAWITERKNLLSALLALTAADLFLRGCGFRDDKRPEPTANASRDWWLSLLVFVAAVFAKTVVCTLPVALAIILWWKRPQLKRADLTPLLPHFALGVGLGLVTAWLERTSVGAQGEIWNLSWLERITIAGRAFWFYPLKLLVPYPLAFIYPRWTPGVHDWPGWCGVFAACLCATLLWYYRKKLGHGPMAAFAIYAVTIAPALGFFDLYFFYYSFVQDHFQYHASIAVLTLMASGLVLVLRRLDRNDWYAALLLLLMLPLAWRQSAQFKDAQTLWEETLRRNPSAWMASINLGNIYLGQQRFADARKQFESALAERPGYDEALYNLGVVNSQQGDRIAAEKCYRDTIASNPKFTKAYNNLANLKLQQGAQAQALDLWREALAIDPLYVLARVNLANNLANSRQLPEAIEVIRAGLTLRPDEPRLNLALAPFLLDAGDIEGARRAAQQAISGGAALPEELERALFAARPAR
jgi:tetratricopeptide (TPR) repeat protein